MPLLIAGGCFGILFVMWLGEKWGYAHRPKYNWEDEAKKYRNTIEK